MTSENKAPLVGLVMGSDSDWPVMEAAADALAEFGDAFHHPFRERQQRVIRGIVRSTR